MVFDKGNGLLLDSSTHVDGYIYTSQESETIKASVTCQNRSQKNIGGSGGRERKGI